MLGAKFAIDDILVDAEFAGFRGIRPDEFSIVGVREGTPHLPAYVYQARKRIPEPERNKQKAYLANWHGPIIDKGNIVTLRMGHMDSHVPARKYDYWTTKAVLDSIPRLQRDLLSGTISLRTLARRMDLVLVVVTADGKVVLARRTDQVDNCKDFWMASVGESLDPGLDSDNDGVPNPMIATRRCLGEPDELNLSRGYPKTSFNKMSVQPK